MNNLDRICSNLKHLGLPVKSVESQTPVGVEFHAETDFDHILATLRGHGYKIIRYVDVSRYVELMPPAA